MAAADAGRLVAESRYGDGVASVSPDGAACVTVRDVPEDPMPVEKLMRRLTNEIMKKGIYDIGLVAPDQFVPFF
eukprot:gene10220-12090_t